jgi:hypothetical protein
MSARVESPPIGGSFAAPILMAILVALGVGALLGAVVTKAVNDRPSGLAPARALVATPVGTAPWDTQKLEAMQGRVLAEQFRVDAAAPIVVTAKPSSTRPPLREQGWDAYKLEAMAGRVLAAGVGAEDPPVKPHLPKRPPRG